MFLNPIIISNLNSNCSNLLDLRNLQEQVKKILFQKLLLPFTVWIICSSDLKNVANYQLFSLEFQWKILITRSFFLTVGFGKTKHHSIDLNIFSLAWEEIPSTSKTMVVPIKRASFPTVTLCPRNSNPDRWGPAIKIFDHLKRNCTTQRQEYLITYIYRIWSFFSEPSWSRLENCFSSCL